MLSFHKHASSLFIQVYVKMVDKSSGNVYLWDKNKFLIRQAYVQEMYEEFLESGSLSKRTKACR